MKLFLALVRVLQRKYKKILECECYECIQIPMHLCMIRHDTCEKEVIHDRCQMNNNNGFGALRRLK